jgi:hypothetical protein
MRLITRGPSSRIGLDRRPAASFAQAYDPCEQRQPSSVSSEDAVAPPQARTCVVGIDNWAWKKNQRYGTIVCDSERRKPVTVSQNWMPIDKFEQISLVHACSLPRDCTQGSQAISRTTRANLPLERSHPRALLAARSVGAVWRRSVGPYRRSAPQARLGI